VILLYSQSEDGHRRSYLDFFTRTFKGRRVTRGEVWLARQPVFFLMIEENFAFFVLAATFRAVLGRRTVGLLFRPLPALRGKGLRLVTKRTILSWLKRMRSVATLAILPFSVEPEFARIATGWIYDPQLWDLNEVDRAVGTVRPGDNSFLAPAIRQAGERKVVVAVGRMDRAKGFDSFARAYARSPDIRSHALFMSCGAINEGVARDRTMLIEAGGIVYDRELTDRELLEVYGAADVVWCCYAADYDQASGILGRAVQLGLPVIVRAGSLIERLCQEEAAPYLAIDPVRFNTLPAIARRTPDRGATLAAKMAQHSLSVLARALGVPPANA